MNVNTANPSVPSYAFGQVNGLYKVEVKAKVLEDSDLKARLILEAKSSSLFATAYIQELAKQGCSLAKELMRLYQGYRSFFSTGNKEELLSVCDAVANHAQADPLAVEMALYMKGVLLGNLDAQTSKTLGAAFAKSLIPSIKKTLSLPLPEKVYSEQKVHVLDRQASHNAFPDMIKYEGEYYLCFREAKAHVAYGDLGKVRVLKGLYCPNTHTWTWENTALIESLKYDLRDPKFFIGKDNQLGMIIDGSIIDEKDETAYMQPHVAFLSEGKWAMQEAHVDSLSNGLKGQWLWRVTWNEKLNCGYSLSYGKDENLYLLKTEDGISYKQVSFISNEKLPKDTLNEATLRFKEDGTAVAFIRTTRNGLIATSTLQSNYTVWSLEVIPFRLGGPNFVICERDAKMWAATRHLFLDEENFLDETTVVGSLDTKRFVPLLKLKSYGDCSYPAMVLEEDNTITIAYYSSNQDDSSDIYITRIRP